MSRLTKGFSKLDRDTKIQALIEEKELSGQTIKLLEKFRIDQESLQKAFEGFSENVISNYHLPYSIIPSLILNDENLSIPIVVEESSVVAAAAKSASFWSRNGGYHAEIISLLKPGHIYFRWNGGSREIKTILSKSEERIRSVLKPITEKMEERGGGIHSFDVEPLAAPENIWKIEILFDTRDSMGANFINSCLEKTAEELKLIIAEEDENQREFEIIMSILSNHVPGCLVECYTECSEESLRDWNSDENFASRFVTAIDIANEDPSRAATHNKGIFNGMDGVLIATGNDWRAVEAAGHAFASVTGRYKSLSTASLNGGIFRHELRVPVNVGTVGGLTTSHPLASLSMDILGKPDAEKLMTVVAAVGLASNFAAVASLVTTGIQKGHMKMHLVNILHHFNATLDEIENAKNFFRDKTVSYSEVRKFLKR